MLTKPSNVLPLHLKQTLPPIILIFTEGEGDGIESRLTFKIFSTLHKVNPWTMNRALLAAKIKFSKSHYRLLRMRPSCDTGLVWQVENCSSSYQRKKYFKVNLLYLLSRIWTIFDWYQDHVLSKFSKNDTIGTQNSLTRKKRNIFKDVLP